MNKFARELRGMVFLIYLFISLPATRKIRFPDILQSYMYIHEPYTLLALQDSDHGRLSRKSCSCFRSEAAGARASLYSREFACIISSLNAPGAAQSPANL